MYFIIHGVLKVCWMLKIVASNEFRWFLSIVFHPFIVYVQDFFHGNVYSVNTLSKLLMVCLLCMKNRVYYMIFEMLKSSFDKEISSIWNFPKKVYIYACTFVFALTQPHGKIYANFVLPLCITSIEVVIYWTVCFPWLPSICLHIWAPSEQKSMQFQKHLSIM